MQESANAPVILDIEKTSLTEEDRELLQHPAVGGLIFFSRNYEDRQQLCELIREIRSVRAELLLCVDHEGGRVQRFRQEFQHLPPMQKLGALFDIDENEARASAEALAWLMASELLSCDIDLSFAPVLDLDHSFSSIIGDRSFSASADTACVLAEAFLDGMHAAGMCTTGKHFPGHGSVKEDSHLELPRDTRNFEEIENHDLHPFVKLHSKLDAMMPAHIVFPAVDAQPVGFSSHWLKTILRKDMGYQGLIFSDDLSMEGAAIIDTFAERASVALNAGCDSVLVCNNRVAAIEVVESVEKDRASLSCRSLKTMKRPHTKLSQRDLLNSEHYQNALKFIERLQAL